jgi:Lipase (class 3)
MPAVLDATTIFIMFLFLSLNLSTVTIRLCSTQKLYIFIYQHAHFIIMKSATLTLVLIVCLSLFIGVAALQGDRHQTTNSDDDKTLAPASSPAKSDDEVIAQEQIKQEKKLAEKADKPSTSDVVDADSVPSSIRDFATLAIDCARAVYSPTHFRGESPAYLLHCPGPYIRTTGNLFGRQPKKSHTSVEIGTAAGTVYFGGDKTEDVTIVAFRGSESDSDWITDLNAILSVPNFKGTSDRMSAHTKRELAEWAAAKKKGEKPKNRLADLDLPFGIKPEACKECGKIHSGFLTYYKTIRHTIMDTMMGMFHPSTSKGVAAPQHIIFTGHSLGAALAEVCLFDLKYNNIIPDNVRVSLIQVGNPRVGTAAWKKKFDEVVGCKNVLPMATTRGTGAGVFQQDPITILPPKLLGYQDTCPRVRIRNPIKTSIHGGELHTTKVYSKAILGDSSFSHTICDTAGPHAESIEKFRKAMNVVDNCYYSNVLTAVVMGDGKCRRKKGGNIFRRVLKWCKNSAECESHPDEPCNGQCICGSRVFKTDACRCVKIPKKPFYCVGTSHLS